LEASAAGDPPEGGRGHEGLLQYSLGGAAAGGAHSREGPVAQTGEQCWWRSQGDCGFGASTIATGGEPATGLQTPTGRGNKKAGGGRQATPGDERLAGGEPIFRRR